MTINDGQWWIMMGAMAYRKNNDPWWFMMPNNGLYLSVGNDGRSWLMMVDDDRRWPKMLRWLMLVSDGVCGWWWHRLPMVNVGQWQGWSVTGLMSMIVNDGPELSLYMVAVFWLDDYWRGHKVAWIAGIHYTTKTDYCGIHGELSVYCQIAHIVIAITTTFADSITTIGIAMTTINDQPRFPIINDSLPSHCKFGSLDFL